MSDLVSRLLAAIEETERLALAASPGPWHANAEHVEVLAVDDEVVCEGFALSGNQLRATVDHIVHNDPAAVLRHCKSDREIVDLYRLFRRAGSDDTADALGAVLRLRARAYGISVEEETTGE